MSKSKGKKRIKRKSGSASAWSSPQPILLLGLVAVIALIAVQQYRNELTSLLNYNSDMDDELVLFSTGEAHPVRLSLEQAQRAERLLQTWKQGGTARRGDVDWITTVALGLSLSSKLDAEQLLHFKAAHVTAVMGAISLGETELAVSLSVNLGKSIRYISSPEARLDVYKALVGSWVVRGETRVLKTALPALDAALEASQFWDDGALVTAIYMDKARTYCWPSRELSRFLQISEECVAWTNAHGHSNDTCVHALVLATQYVDELDRSMALYRDHYRNHLGDFRSLRDGRPCTPTLHLLSLDSMTPEERSAVPHVTVHRVATGLDEQIRALPPLDCSSQEWPYFLHSEDIRLASSNYSILRRDAFVDELTWSIGELKDHRFFEVRCITNADKKPVLLEFDDVYIHGYGRTISSASDCSVFHVGFPFSSRSAPPFHEVVTLPVEELDQAGLLSQLQNNFFHMVVGESQQTILGRLFDAWPSDDLPLIVGAEKLVAVALPQFGVAVDRLVPYMPRDKVYHVKKLFVTDWEFSDEGGFTRHTDDYFVPAQGELRVLRQNLMQGVSLPTSDGKYVLFVNRNPADTKWRSVSGFELIVRELRLVAERHGASFRMHDDSLPLAAQIVSFHGAAVVIGPHGAGLANVLFCRPGTALIEFPTFPYKPSVFAMLSAALQIEYWTLPGAEAYFFESYNLTDADITRLRATLSYLLSK